MSAANADVVADWISVVQRGITFGGVFIALYVGHMLGDHIAQTDRQAADKAGPWRGTASGALVGHVSSYAACQMAAIYAVLWVTGLHVSYVGWLAGIGFSAISHGFIDRRWPVQWVCRHTGSEAFGKLASGGLNGAYLVDQSLHIACLFVAALLMTGLTAS